MSKLSLITFFLFTTVLYSQTYDWANSFGGSWQDFGNEIVVDNEGNSIVVGHFNNTVDFDPGNGTYNLTSSGASDIFILKLDTEGGLVWAKSIGGVTAESAKSSTVDDFGDILITGYFYDTVDFDPGPNTYSLTSNGMQDIFILKLSNEGNFLWAKSMGATNGSDIGNSIKTDIMGNVLVTGQFEETVDFDPSANIFNLSSIGNSDIFILKLDVEGNFSWAKNIGSSSSDYGHTIDIGSENFIYISGYFNDQMDFDPGPGVFEITPFGSYDAFILKLDLSGNFIWGKNFGGENSNTNSRSISIDLFNNVYTVGEFSQTVDFDPSPNQYNLTAEGASDTYISKLDENGNFQWALRIGGLFIDRARSVVNDIDGFIYIAGEFNHTVDFNPGTDIYNLTSAGDLDVYIMKLNSNGDFIWAVQMGGIETDICNSLERDLEGNIYTTGFFSGVADFDPGTSTSTLTSNGNFDIFISKISDDTFLGNNENKYNNEILIFPNPTQSYIYVNSKNFEINEIQIIDTTGKIIFNEKNTNNLNKLNFSFYPTGIYFVKISTDKVIKTFKVLRK